MSAMQTTVQRGDEEVSSVQCSAPRDINTYTAQQSDLLSTNPSACYCKVIVSLVAIKENSRGWARTSGRPDWEVREAACLAMGIVGTPASTEAVVALNKSLQDERNEVQRAAMYAMGQIAERTAPKDMVWTYNNATAQPARKSTHTCSPFAARCLLPAWPVAAKRSGATCSDNPA